MMNYKISKELHEAILQYLASRPYAEVFRAITALQGLEPIEEQSTEDKDGYTD